MTDPQIDTSLWKLWLRLSNTSLTTIMIGPESVESSVRFSVTELQPASTPLRSLEEAVYSTPMLPADFASVVVMIDTPDFALMPPVDSTTAEMAARTLMPDALEGSEPITSAPLGLNQEVALTMLYDAQQLNFLRRTFANPLITHPLAAVGQYLSHINYSAGDPRRAWAIMTADTLLMFCFDTNGRITFANRYAIGSESDAAYFILAALPTDCRLMIGGPSALRNAVAELLRPYVDPVMPITLSANLLHLLGAAPTASLDILMLTQI